MDDPVYKMGVLQSRFVVRKSPAGLSSSKATETTKTGHDNMTATGGNESQNESKFWQYVAVRTWRKVKSQQQHGNKQQCGEQSATFITQPPEAFNQKNTPTKTTPVRYLNSQYNDYNVQHRHMPSPLAAQLSRHLSPSD